MKNSNCYPQVLLFFSLCLHSHLGQVISFRCSVEIKGKIAAKLKRNHDGFRRVGFQLFKTIHLHSLLGHPGLALALTFANEI